MQWFQLQSSANTFPLDSLVHASNKIRLPKCYNCSEHYKLMLVNRSVCLFGEKLMLQFVARCLTSRSVVSVNI
jgi:NAD-dependent SIR2 family protein deacetylase